LILKRNLSIVTENRITNADNCNKSPENNLTLVKLLDIGTEKFMDNTDRELSEI